MVRFARRSNHPQGGKLGKFPDVDMDDDEQASILDAAVDAVWEPCEQAAIDLINTAPTTLAGIVVAIQYLRKQMEDDGTFMPQCLLLDTAGDAQDTMGLG